MIYNYKNFANLYVSIKIGKYLVNTDYFSLSTLLIHNHSQIVVSKNQCL